MTLCVCPMHKIDAMGELVQAKDPEVNHPGPLDARPPLTLSAALADVQLLHVEVLALPSPLVPVSEKNPLPGEFWPSSSNRTGLKILGPLGTKSVAWVSANGSPSMRTQQLAEAPSRDLTVVVASEVTAVKAPPAGSLIPAAVAAVLQTLS